MLTDCLGNIMTIIMEESPRVFTRMFTILVSSNRIMSMKRNLLISLSLNKGTYYNNCLLLLLLLLLHVVSVCIKRRIMIN